MEVSIAHTSQVYLIYLSAVVRERIVKRFCYHTPSYISMALTHIYESLDECASLVPGG